ncbi:unnamed protein product [Lampetra planeri]
MPASADLPGEVLVKAQSPSGPPPVTGMDAAGSGGPPLEAPAAPPPKGSPTVPCPGHGPSGPPAPWADTAHRDGPAAGNALAGQAHMLTDGSTVPGRPAHRHSPCRVAATPSLVLHRLALMFCSSSSRSGFAFWGHERRSSSGPLAGWLQPGRLSFFMGGVMLRSGVLRSGHTVTA